MKAGLKNMRKMFMLQVPVDSECSEVYEKYYCMKFLKSLDSCILFECVAKGDFFSVKNLYLHVKKVSAKALPVIFFPILDLIFGTLI